MKDFENVNSVIERVLLTEEQIRDKVTEIGARISDEYKGREPLMLCILSGSFMFASDLMRAITIPVGISFIYASSYGDASVSSGEVDIRTGKGGLDVSGRDVIIVEDIVDTGRTLTAVKKYLEDKGAKSVEICTFLDKPERRVFPLDVKYMCFDIPNEFVVGYGLDYAYKYRQLPFVGVLKPEIYTK